MDIKNKRFGKLLAIEKCERLGKENREAWLFTCDCGKQKKIIIKNVLRGTSRSCGCLLRTQNGMVHSKPYRSWVSMKKRCLYKKHPAYDRYAGRGITICKEWMDFKVFYKDMGDAPSDKHCIDRIDNNKGYYKENCRWATHQENNSNRSDNHFITYKNKIKTVAGWADFLKINRNSLYYRLSNGWDEQEALSTPFSRQIK